MQLAEHDRAAAALGEKQSELTEQLAEARHQRAAIGSRLHLLDEMHQAREGLGDAVKRVLNHPEHFAGVRGLLATLSTPIVRHAHLVEAALGANLELLLVDSIQDVERLSSSLRELNGRVGLIALDVRTNRLPMAGELPGHATPLLSFIRVEPQAQAAIRTLAWSNTAVVFDLQTALAIHPQLNGWRLVTTSGDVVEADGRVIFGRASAATGAGDGWLTRRIELAEHRARVIALDTRIETLNAMLNALLSETAQTEQQQQAIDHQLRAAQHRVVESQYQSQRLGNDLHRIQRETSALEAEQTELNERLQRLSAERNDLAAKLHECSVSLAEHQQIADEAQNLLQIAQEQSDAAQEKLTGARVELGELGQKLETARRERRHLQLTAEETARQDELCKQQLHRRLSQIEQYEAVIAEAGEEMAFAEASMNELAGREENLRSQLHTAGEILLQASKKLEAARAQANHIDRDYHAVELSRRELEVKREGLEERTLTDLELDLATAYIPYRSTREEESFQPLNAMRRRQRSMVCARKSANSAT